MKSDYRLTIILHLLRDEGIRILISKYKKTTVGHTGSNACGEDKVHVFSEKKKQMVFVEAGKRITPVVS